MDLVRKKHLNTMEGSQFYISLKIAVKNYFCTNMVYKMIFFFQLTYYITIIMVYFRHATFQCTGRPCCSMAVVGRSRATSPKTASLPCGKGKIPDKNEKYLSGHVNDYGNWICISFSFMTVFDLYILACMLSRSPHQSTFYNCKLNQRPYLTNMLWKLNLLSCIFSKINLFCDQIWGQYRNM